MARLSVVVFFFAMAGCLTAGGRKVAYVRNDASRFRQCRRIGQLRVTGNEIALRNRAAVRGATHLNILERSRTLMGGVKTTAELYHCATDVGGIR